MSKVLYSPETEADDYAIAKRIAEDVGEPNSSRVEKKWKTCPPFGCRPGGENESKDSPCKKP